MEKKTKKVSPVIFRAHWKRYAKPGLSTKLLVFLYSGSGGEKKLNTEISKRTKQLKKPDWDHLTLLTADAGGGPVFTSVLRTSILSWLG